MTRRSLLVARWAGVCSLMLGSVWACSSGDTNPFEDLSRGGQSTSGGSSNGGTSGGSSGSSSGGEATGGASGGKATGGADTGGNATGGDETGGSPTGGTTGDGGESGTDATGGTATGGSATGGNATGGAGMGGAGAGGAAGGGKGGAAGGGMGGSAGTPATGGAGMSGSGGSAGKGCKANGDCASTEYCKKTTCNAMEGHCAARGPDCSGDKAAFEPVCGCDDITYWNTCVIEHEGFNVAMAGECTGNGRPTCTRDQGGDSCPTRLHAHCYRPVDRCGDSSPMVGVCWVLPAECPPNEQQTERYCGGTGGSARCIGLCEVIDAENSFQRDAGTCN
jgi:hypothetical protein